MTKPGPAKESDAGFSSIEKDDWQKAGLSTVFAYLKPRELLAIRRVSQTWNKVASSRLKDKLIFKVCQNPLSIAAFQNLTPSFQVQRFRFDGVDLEQLLGDESVFKRFSMSHCLQMTSLTIQNCPISTGRFFELLAFCKQLNHLVLKDVPSIYRIDNGLGIVNWGFCFKHVRANLAKVENLLISESLFLRNADVWGLASGMKSLTRLLIGCDRALPIQGVNKVLRNSGETLKWLTLRGMIHPNGLLLDVDFYMKELRTLCFLKCKLDSGTVKYFERFLGRCPKLDAMKIQESHLEKTTLGGVQEKLTVLVLSNCTLDANAFEGSKFDNLKVLKIQVPIQYTDPDHTPTVSGVTSLFKSKLPQLEELALELQSHGSAYLRGLDAKNYPKLSVLSLNNCNDIAGPPLRKIFQDFKELQSLTIKNCQEIIDENVCYAGDDDVKKSLANMKNLKTLNLSGTQVGNQTVRDCIAKLEQLESIQLNDTKVTEDGLRAIADAVQSKLTSLKEISIAKCKMGLANYKKLIRIAPNVNIQCQVITAEGNAVDITNESLNG